MELSSDVLEGLGICGNSAHVTDQAYQKLIPLTFQVLLGRKDENALAGDSDVSSIDPGVFKQSYSALVTLILEAGKIDSDEATISSLLEDCKWSSDRVNFLCQVFSEKKIELQAILSSTTSSFPHIVDVDWRLDYYIKNKHMDKVNKPNYLITLKTEECGEPNGQDIQFACSLEQLQDLVGKLKDACKSVEKASQL